MCDLQCYLQGLATRICIVIILFFLRKTSRERMCPKHVQYRGEASTTEKKKWGKEPIFFFGAYSFLFILGVQSLSVLVLTLAIGRSSSGGASEC